MGVPCSRLFGFRYEVEPNPRHPQFFEKQAGYLYIWILATQEEEAFTNAFMILELLPYTLISEEVGLIDSQDPGFDGAEVADAKVSGLKVVWESVGFEEDWSHLRGEEAG